MKSELLGMACEFIIMVAMLIAVWFFGKKEGINNEKNTQAQKRSDAVARGLSAGNRARANYRVRKE